MVDWDPRQGPVSTSELIVVIDGLPETITRLIVWVIMSHVRGRVVNCRDVRRCRPEGRGEGRACQAGILSLAGNSSHSIFHEHPQSFERSSP